MCFGIDSSLISPCTLRRIFLYFVSEIFSSSELYGTVFRLRGYLFPSQRYKGRKRGIKGKKRWEKGQCRSYHKNNPCWKEKCKKIWPSDLPVSGCRVSTWPKYFGDRQSPPQGLSFRLAIWSASSWWIVAKFYDQPNWRMGRKGQKL